MDSQKDLWTVKNNSGALLCQKGDCEWRWLIRWRVRNRVQEVKATLDITLWTFSVAYFSIFVNSSFESMWLVWHYETDSTFFL